MEAQCWTLERISGFDNPNAYHRPTFSRLYNGASAQRMRLNLLDDAEFWTFLKVQFEAGILAAGIEPDSLPSPVIGDLYLVPQVERGKWIAQCPDCQSYSVIRRGNIYHVCYSCWNQGVPLWRTVGWMGNASEVEAHPFAPAQCHQPQLVSGRDGRNAEAREPG